MRAASQSIVAVLWTLMIGSDAAFAEDPKPSESSPDKAIVSIPEIEALLEPIRAKHKVPGLVAGLVEGDRLTFAGAVGLRKLGSPEPITIHDKVHIGSDAKAMTATQIARLVEESKLSWQSTIGEVFPHLKSELHPDFHDVTLTQLLTHRAGLPADGPWRALGGGTLGEQRDALLKKVLSQPAVHPPGTEFLYSNVGYAVAGHIAEQVAGKPWEELMTATLFEPLGMKSAGFGPPGTKNEVDQPWGHQSLFGFLLPLQADNAPALGPAGTVHLSLPDWSRFIALHLQGARGEAKFMRAETFKTLHTPPAGQEYALGWGVVEEPWTKGPALSHAGSNTFWFAAVWITPGRNAAFLAAANAGGDAGQKACNDAILALTQYQDKISARTATETHENRAVEILQTVDGVRFGVRGSKPDRPAPTLFVFAHEIGGTLTSDDYNKVGRLLGKDGVVSVALDLPCHGQNVRAGEPAGLDGWAARSRKDEDFVAVFTKQASAVLDHLIAEGYTDREKVVACGTSRGGFLALHFAAAEPRVRCVAAFAPVTELAALTEFQGLDQHPATIALDLKRHAEKLTERPVWLCIGSHDERVDTDRAIALTRAIVQGSVAAKKVPLVELHVMPSAGHSLPPTAHAEAGAWFSARLKEERLK